MTSPKLSRDFQMMFIYLDDPKKTLAAIDQELKSGWVLYSMNEDKAYFYMDVEDQSK